jgi:hypothetical protein
MEAEDVGHFRMLTKLIIAESNPLYTSFRPNITMYSRSLATPFTARTEIGQNTHNRSVT